MKKNDGMLEALRSLITESIRANPVERDGFQWAAIPQQEICVRLNIAPATLRRMVSQSPFVRLQARINAKNYSLLRISVPGEAAAIKTPEHIGNIMKKIWREWLTTRQATILAQREAMAVDHPELSSIEREAKQLKRLLHHQQLNSAWGCFRNLAELWPEGHQVELFKLVLKDWSAFMAGVKVEIWRRGTGTEKFFAYPSIPVIREFHAVALELYVMVKQEKTEALSPELLELSECIYVH